MKFPTFIAKRIAQSVFVLLGLSILIFTLSRALPGDPAKMALGPRAPEWRLEQYREELHLKEPLHVQYYYWLKDLSHGKLGESIFTRRDVMTDIKEFFPATLELILFGAVVDVNFALLLGIIAGRNANRWPDNLVRIFSYVGIAFPAFFVAILLMVIFGQQLGIMPIYGRIDAGVVRPPAITGMLTVDALLTGNLAAFGDALKHLVLPGVSLVIGCIAQEARIIRAGIVENLRKEYIAAGRSYGLSERVLMWKYLLKSSVIPAVAIMGLDIASLLQNAFLVELIFNWPGLSRYGVHVLFNKDINGICGIVLMIGLMYLVANIIVDVLVAYLDPRIRIERGK